MKIKQSIHLVLGNLDKQISQGRALIKQIHLVNWGSISPELKSQEIDQVKEKIKKWTNATFCELDSIFEDSEPKFRFENYTSLIDFPGMPNEISPKFDTLKYRIGIICDFYREIEKTALTPLKYINSTCTLRHFDTVLPLLPESNERYLCEYLFNKYDFGELVDIEKVYEDIFSPRDGKIKASKITSAARAVNDKTRKSFGFNIFELPRGRIRLCYPERNNES